LRSNDNSLLERLRRWVRSWRSTLSKPSVREIASRYFVMNAFDGSMSMLGIIVGATTAKGGARPNVIISAGWGAALAWAISGALGAFMAERAERMRHLRELEEAMLTDLNDSQLYSESMRATFFLSVVDAVAPALPSVITLVPFYMAVWGLISTETAITASVIIILISLFGLGMLIGRISKENILFHGLVTVVAGIVTFLLCSAIPF